MTIEICASGCCWWHHTLEEGMRQAAAAGFTAYEPLLFPPQLFRLHGDLHEVPAAALSALLRRHGLRPAALHIGAIVTDERLGACIDYARLAIAAAAETGCRLVVVGGPPREGQPFAPFLDAIAALCPALAAHDVRLALENHRGNSIEGLADYERVFARIDDPRVGITLDTGHCTAAGVDPLAIVARFGARVQHVHVKDHQGHRSVPLGSGTTDNDGVVAALRRVGYAGFLSQEIECGQGPEADRAAAEGIDYMRRLVAA